MFVYGWEAWARAISEPLLPEVRAAAAAAWAAPVANGYGMSEGLFAGATA